VKPQTNAAGPSSSIAARLARYYDIDLLDDPGDVDLYVALAARTDGPILELGAGSGRIAVPLAAAGHDVTAVDLDPGMLERATRRWEVARDAGGRQRPKRSRTSVDKPAARGELRSVVGDMTDIRLDKRFDLVIIGLNTLLQLGDAHKQLAALRTVAAHLLPKGRAVVDVWLPAPDDLALYDGRVILEWQRDDPETGETISKFASARYDAATATVTLSQWFDAVRGSSGPVTRTARTDRMRLVPAAELTHLATLAGLKTQTLAGDYRMAPFGPGDERAILIGRLI
jgi:SAM-dependent methyltransferase